MHNIPPELFVTVKIDSNKRNSSDRQTQDLHACTNVKFMLFWMKFGIAALCESWSNYKFR
jgi:hypothetical protein